MKTKTLEEKITSALTDSKKEISNPNFVWPMGIIPARGEHVSFDHKFDNQPLSYVEKQALALYRLGMASAGQIFCQISKNTQLKAAMKEAAMERLLFQAEMKPDEALFDEAVKIACDIDDRFSFYTADITGRMVKVERYPMDEEPIVQLKALSSTDIKR